MLDYTIQPLLMGGLVKSFDSGFLTIHLNGRLGVLTLSRRLLRDGCAPSPGSRLRFFFSYLEVVETLWDCDSAPLNPARELSPCLLGGPLIEVNDTAVKLQLPLQLGTVAVPRRWVFTPLPLQPGLSAQVYLSCLESVPQPV